MKALLAAGLLALSTAAGLAASAKPLPAPKTDLTLEEKVEFFQSASGLGILAMCDDTGLHSSPISEDTIARHVNIAKALFEAGEPFFFQGAQANFQGARRDATYITGKVENGQPVRTDVEISTTEGCKRVENDLLELRKPGRLLDVAPLIEGDPA